MDLSINPYTSTNNLASAEFIDLAVKESDQDYVLMFRAQDINSPFEVLKQTFESDKFAVQVGDPELRNIGVKKHIDVLIGNTTVAVVDGVAMFTDLVIQQVSTFTGSVKGPPTVLTVSCVLEFLEASPEPGSGVSLIFPGNRFTSESFKVASGELVALGVKGFGSQSVYVSTELPTLKSFGEDKYGNFVSGGEGLVKVELSSDTLNVFDGNAPQPVDEFLTGSRLRQSVDGLSVFDVLVINNVFSGVFLTFWTFNENVPLEKKPETTVILGPFKVNSPGTLNFLNEPSPDKYAGSVLFPVSSVQIISTTAGSEGQVVKAVMQVRVRLYTYLGVERDLEWFTLSDTPLMDTFTQNTENGEDVFPGLIIEKTGSFKLVFNLVLDQVSQGIKSVAFRFVHSGGRTGQIAPSLSFNSLQLI